MEPQLHLAFTPTPTSATCQSDMKHWTPIHIAIGAQLGWLSSPSTSGAFATLSFLELQRFLSTPPHVSAQLQKNLKYKFLNLPSVEDFDLPHLFQIIDPLYQEWSSQFTILTPLSEAYPKAFRILKSPPSLLFIEGQLPSAENWNLAVVGKREPQRHTCLWMEQNFYGFLKATKSINIISGGARGIDQKAHLGALIYQHPTFAFLPSGLLHVYPTSLLQYKQQILAGGGGLISHLLPHIPMHKKNFYYRNELIAALSDACLILEAQKRSGTYQTAVLAQTHGKNTLVVPSFPHDQNYSGSLQLLFDGSQMIRDQEDLLSFMALNFQNSTDSVIKV